MPEKVRNLEKKRGLLYTEKKKTPKNESKAERRILQ